MPVWRQHYLFGQLPTGGFLGIFLFKKFYLLLLVINNTIINILKPHLCKYLQLCPGPKAWMEWSCKRPGVPTRSALHTSLEAPAAQNHAPSLSPDAKQMGMGAGPSHSEEMPPTPSVCPGRLCPSFLGDPPGLVGPSISTAT